MRANTTLSTPLDSRPVKRGGSSLFQGALFRGAAGALLMLCALAAHAQERPPSDIPPLPAPGSDTPLYITGKNVSLYHELLIAPVASWLKEGKFVLRATKDLAEPWSLSEEWTEQSRVNATRFSLDDTHTPRFNGERMPTFGFPFGDAAAVNKEPDLSRRAYQVLWNSLYAQFPTRDLFYGFTLASLSPQGPLRRVGGVLYREFQVEPTSPPGDVMFKELVQLVSPPVVYGLSSLTWRTRGVDEDQVWIYSPVTERGRKVFSSNRGDPLLERFFSVDDLFVFSEKIQTVRAKVVDEREFFAPFAALRPIPLQPERASQIDASVVNADQPPSDDQSKQGQESVLTARGVASQSAGQTASQASGAPSPLVLWNHETTLYPNSAAWIPTTVTFVPRKLWVVEISSLDPYYPWGRQIVFIDQGTMLPVYKIVYDMRGVYAKTVLGGWSLAVSEDRRVAFPVLGFLLEVERGSRTATSFTAQYVKTFEGRALPAAQSLKKLLDISAHGPRRSGGSEGGDESEKPAADSVPSQPHHSEDSAVD